MKTVPNEEAINKLGFLSKLSPLKLDEAISKLKAYSRQLEPAAFRIARLSTNGVVDKVDEALSQRKEEVLKSNIGYYDGNEQVTIENLYRRQVDLITGIPRDLADRLVELKYKLLIGQLTPSEIKAELTSVYGLTESKAKIISRTETSNAMTSLLKVKAVNLGSPGYTWETSQDPDVRSSHAKMQGKFVRWDEPPTFDDGYSYHAGEIWYCRCWPRIAFDEVEKVKTNDKRYLSMDEMFGRK